MIAATVWNELKETLENDPTLSDYISIVFEGVRYNVDAVDLPCIMLEPFQNGELIKDMNQYKDLLFSVDIYAFSSNNVQQFTKTIVGDDDYKGILEIENDIRACLQSSYTLSENVIDIRFEPSSFNQGDFNKYPVRGLLMPIKIMYRQQDGS